MELKLISFLLIVGAGLVFEGATTAAQTTNATTPTMKATTAGTTQMQTTGVTPNATTGNTTTGNTTTGNATTGNTPTTNIPTTHAPTTSPVPPSTGHFKLNDSTGQACILEDIQATFQINYTRTDQSMGTITFVLPQNSAIDTAASMCGNASQDAVLALTWGMAVYGNKFEQTFGLTATTSQLSKIALYINHTEDAFPNSTQQNQLVLYNMSLPNGTFATDSSHSFSCVSDEFFKIDSNSNVTFSDVRVQALGIAQGVFSPAAPCPEDMNSTTAFPFTTNASSPSPSHSPSPSPSPSPATQGSWNVTYSNGTVCMMVNMSMNFIITYNTTKNKMERVNVSLPIDADASSSTCGKDNAKFRLTFPGQESGWYAIDAAKNWTMEMDFKMNDNSYKNTELSLTYFYDSHFTDPMNPGTEAEASTNDTKIEADMGHYYACNANRTFSSNAGSGDVSFQMNHVAIQPFANNFTQNGGFGITSTCAADETFNNIVPIAVGCALAGLVIIVLIAYLIGRQRSSKTGYESV